MSFLGTEGSKCFLSGKFQDYCDMSQHTPFSLLSKNDQMTIYLRCGLDKVQRGALICRYHIQKFLKLFETNEKYCCDPLKYHKSSIRRDIRIISNEKSILFNMVLTEVEGRCVPGQKICQNCRKILYTRAQQIVPAPVVSLPEIVFEDPLQASQESTSDTFSQFLSDEKSENPDSEETFSMPTETRLDTLNSVFSILSLSPFKFKDHHVGAKIFYTECKYASVCKSLQKLFESTVNIENLNFDKQISPEKIFFEELMKNLKAKINSAAHGEQISLLTLAPNFWTIE